MSDSCYSSGSAAYEGVEDNVVFVGIKSDYAGCEFEREHGGMDVVGPDTRYLPKLSVSPLTPFVSCKPLTIDFIGSRFLEYVYIFCLADSFESV